MRFSPGEVLSAIAAIIAALISSAVSWNVGHKHGQSEFIGAVHEAAHIVIEDLRIEIARMREHLNQCEGELSQMRKDIDELMRGPIAGYRLDSLLPRRRPKKDIPDV